MKYLLIYYRDTLLQSLQERVSHLEDLLSEATTELNSHQVSTIMSYYMYVKINIVEQH